MPEVGIEGQALNLEEGWLCLDFANTVSMHASDHPEERLNDYTDLVEWAQTEQLVTADAAARLLAEAEERPGDAAQSHQYAIRLRDAIYEIYAALAHDEQPRPADLDALNEALMRGLSHLRVVQVGDGFRWEWDVRRDSLYQMLWPVARSAADLLTSEDMHRVGQCADEDGCGWLFYDTSKNHSRRWCGATCANRAKARRYYARVKEAREGD